MVKNLQIKKTIPTLTSDDSETTNLDGGNTETSDSLGTNDYTDGVVVTPPILPDENNKNDGDSNSTNDNINNEDSNYTEEIEKLKNSLLEYGSLMSGKRVYSRTKGPKYQELIINIVENIFVETFDYALMEKKILFFIKFAEDLAKTDDNWLGEALAYRGLDRVKLPYERVENYARLMNLVIRLNCGRNKWEELKLISLDYSFEFHPKQITAESAKNIITEYCNRYKNK